mgnify:CR=1 FL=1
MESMRETKAMIYLSCRKSCGIKTRQRRSVADENQSGLFYDRLVLRPRLSVGISNEYDSMCVHGVSNCKFQAKFSGVVQVRKTPEYISRQGREVVLGLLCELSVLKRETNNSVPQRILIFG